MGTLAIVLYLVAAVINLLPVSGLFGPARFEALYAIPFQDPNLIVLMRHRAVLFGIVGVLLAASAFLPGLRNIATIVGLVSMVSYVVIMLGGGETNAALSRVLWVDGVGIAALLGAAAISRWGLRLLSLGSRSSSRPFDQRIAAPYTQPDTDGKYQKR